MNLLADENIEAPIISRLRADGHVVTSIAETQPGITDMQVLQIANQLQILLLTGDKDFGDLIFLQRLRAPPGIILLRLPETLPTSQKAEIVSGVFQAYATQLVNAFSVISHAGVRITPFPQSTP